MHLQIGFHSSDAAEEKQFHDDAWWEVASDFGFNAQAAAPRPEAAAAPAVAADHGTFNPLMSTSSGAPPAHCAAHVLSLVSP